MSRFQNQPLTCPACGVSVDFEAVISVNADRRPDLRQAILTREFQRRPCPKCGAAFRLDPEFTYLHVGGRLWIGAFPIAKLGQWQAIEDQARATYERAYGAKASAAARDIGKDLAP